MPNTKTGLSLALLTLFLLSAGARKTEAATIVVDNTDSAFSILSGPWTTAASSGDYGDNYFFKLTVDDPPGLVEWRPAIPATGTYEVAVWYKAGTNRANNAHYLIESADGPFDVYVNQSQTGSQWVTLGSTTSILDRAGAWCSEAMHRQENG